VMAACLAARHPSLLALPHCLSFQIDAPSYRRKARARRLSHATQ
jgi:hypothetical protein